MNNKLKTPPQKLHNLSPKSEIAPKLYKSPKSLTSPRSFEHDRANETESLKKTINLLNEERNLLYEFKKMAVPKISNLETQLEKTKTLYESEISCMQEYINLLKSTYPSISSEAHEQIQSEKAKSLTFYRALVKKHAECEENHKASPNKSVLEKEIKKLQEEITQTKASETEKNSYIEDLLKKLREKDYAIYQLQQKTENDGTSRIKDVIEKLKNDLRLRVSECVNQAISNFSILTCNLNNLEEKLKKIENSQKNIIDYSGKWKSMTLMADLLASEKNELEKNLEKEKNAKARIEEQRKVHMKTIKILENSIENLKVSYENKVNSLIKDSQELGEKNEKIDKLRAENIELKKKNRDLSDFISKHGGKENIESFEKENADLTEKMKKIPELTQYLQSLEDENRDITSEIVQKNKKIKQLSDQAINDQAKIKELSDFKYSFEKKSKLMQLELNEIKKKVASEMVQEKTNDHVLRIERPTSIIEIKGLKKQPSRIKQSFTDNFEPEGIERLSVQLFMKNELLIEKDKNIEELLIRLNEELLKNEDQQNCIDSLTVKTT